MRIPTLVLAAAFSFPAVLRSQTSTSPTITVVDGTTEGGRATDLWLAMLRQRLSASAYDSVAPLVRPLMPEERAWRAMIAEHATSWPSAVAPLLSLFRSVQPRPIRIVVGNRGAEDAFTHDSLTIGFDLAALLRVYGPASAPDNGDKLDRFVRHETIHTLQKRWFVNHPFVARSPLDHALLDVWREGLGNYYSLSPSWSPASDGTPSELTHRTLAALEPRFVERITALACADSVTARPLLVGLSSGPFDRKWGAVPAALWLLAEQRTDSGALRRFVAEGPRGVWELARRHLTPVLADSLMRARRAASACANGLG